MVQKAHAALGRDEIGTPFLIRSTMDMDVRPGFVGLDWRYTAARMGGGALMDGGTHSISACRYLFGEVQAVAAQMTNYGFREFAPLEDTCLLLLRFESGASGTIAISWIAQRERPRTEFVLLGTEGTIEFDTHARQFFVTRNGRRVEEFVLQPSRGFVEQMAHFMACLREDRDPITSPDEQIGSLKVVLAAYRSAQTGRTIAMSDIET
jgi:predicted dehydrogenase